MVIYFLAALIPALGSIPGSGVFPNPGASTAKTAGLLLLRYIMGLFLVMMLYMVVIHQIHIDAMLGGMADFYEADSELRMVREDLLDIVDGHHRTFGHGAWHGGIFGILGLIPLLVYQGIAHQHNWKSILLEGLRWSVICGITGALICWLG